MFNDIEVKEESLEWINNNNKVSVQVKDLKQYMIEKEYLLCLICEDRSFPEIVVIDKTGNYHFLISSADDFIIRFLENHKDYGIVVVVSIKDEHENWKNVYYQIDCELYELKLLGDV